MGNSVAADPRIDRTVLHSNLGAGFLLGLVLIFGGAWMAVPLALVEVLIGSWALARASRDGLRLITVAMGLWALAIALWFVVGLLAPDVASDGVQQLLWTLYFAAVFGTISLVLWQLTALVLRAPIRIAQGFARLAAANQRRRTTP